MALVKSDNPWNPGFAIPKHVKDEPPGRGSMVTKAVRRRHYDLPAEWNWTGGFAVPEYVLHDKIGQDKGGSYGVRRKEIDSFVPGSLQGLGDTASSVDPITQFGFKAADHLLSTLNSVPADLRSASLNALLDELEPGLPGKVADLAKKMSLRDAMAQAMSAGLVKELVNLGKGKTPQPKSLMGLGCYSDRHETALDGFWSTVKSVVTAPYRGVKYVGGKIVSGIKKVTSTTLSWAKSGLSKVDDLVWAVVSSPTGQAAAMAAAGATGGPAAAQAGAAGAQLGAQMCQKNQSAPAPAFLPAGTPSWVLPAAIGGGVLVLALVLTRK